MLTQGFGESSPIADNDSDEGRERNRRVELKVTEASDVGAGTGTGTGDTSSANDSSLSEPANGGAAPDLSEVGTSAAPADPDVPEAPQPGPVDPLTGGQYAAPPTTPPYTPRPPPRDPPPPPPPPP